MTLQLLLFWHDVMGQRVNFFAHTLTITSLFMLAEYFVSVESSYVMFLGEMRNLTNGNIQQWEYAYMHHA